VRVFALLADQLLDLLGLFLDHFFRHKRLEQIIVRRLLFDRVAVELDGVYGSIRIFFLFSFSEILKRK